MQHLNPPAHAPWRPRPSPTPIADGPIPFLFPDAHLPQPGEAHAIWCGAPAPTSIGPGSRRDGTGTAIDRGTAAPGSNLTPPAPSGSDLIPPNAPPGSISPDSRPVRDHGLLDGTRQGPAQPQ